MSNCTINNIFYKMNGSELHGAVRTALMDASVAMRKAYGLLDFDLGAVSTKNNFRIGFSKFVEGNILKKPDVIFNKEYIENAYAAYQTGNYDMSVEMFDRFALCDKLTEFQFRKTYIYSMKQGIGMMLLRLHSLNAIILPAGFNWPVTRSERGTIGDFEGDICNELMIFIRSLKPANLSDADPAIVAVIPDQKSAEYFLTYGTKLLLATGWCTNSDIDLNDLIKIKESMVAQNQSRDHFPFKRMIDVFARKFGRSEYLSVELWDEKIRQSDVLQEEEAKRKIVRVRNSATGRSNSGRSTSVNIIDMTVDKQPIEASIMAPVLAQRPTAWSPRKIEKQKYLSGLDFDFPKMREKWISVENIYLNRYPFREKSMNEAIGFFNIYLFSYLPCWFNNNPMVALRFPALPKDLTPGIFVSRLLDISSNLPMTFLEFMKLVAKVRDWSKVYLRIILKLLQKFFEWIERHASLMDGCDGFKQPFSDQDFPVVPGRRGTNKMPIPSEIFGWMMDYAEMQLGITNRIMELALDGELDVRLLKRNAYHRVDGRLEIDYIGNAKTKFKKGPICFVGNFINVSNLAEIIGYRPVIIRDGKTIFPDVIPNMIDSYRVDVIGKGKMEIPHPHALIHSLTAMYTGIRNSHIQWLDCNKFDEFSVETNSIVTLLHVATDKSGNSFIPVVNWRVIELLRQQKRWRSLIDEGGFRNLHDYNGDDKNPYEKILPLFSWGSDGAPYSDDRYSDAMKNLLTGMVAIMDKLQISKKYNLLRLAVPGVSISDDEVTWWNKSTEHSEYAMGNVEMITKFSKLVCQSDITPHSCRVTVVAEYLTVLPPEIIGKEITGQAPQTVIYYSNHPGARADILDANNYLVMAVANMGRVRNIIQADNMYSHKLDVSSSTSPLVKSLKSNLPAALADYGCSSLTPDKDASNGLDVIIELGLMHAAFNDAEICPYGNRCPKDVLVSIGDARRCGICKYAIRSIDHLPAVEAKQRIFTVELGFVANKLQAAKKEGTRYSDADIEKLKREANLISQEILGYRLASEALNERLRALREEGDTRKWVVQQPEMIAKDLRRVEAPSNEITFTLSILEDAVSYPGMETAGVLARAHKFSRKLRANLDGFLHHISELEPIEGTAEAAGLLRSLIAAKRLSPMELVELLEGDVYIAKRPLQGALSIAAESL
ncbi:hypothetical protein GJ699_00140 [Duganella sp. FT80W]|uniref:Uncharacterized protein n=1 Tax=Duganella guangzhouensis TaxID=2666084 RepID=A0A6I2KSS9_9BURK|nr:hypothetical protein [Duganella guangzhouensis]MRW88392.1 hypothetical protein [Duganella guangzhouensis]